MKNIIMIVLLFVCCCSSVFACNSAIISGKATPDGRPLLWKHRDAREQENQLRFFHGEKHDFIGMVNTKDTKGTQVWMGSNDAGFSIMNTNAYNLNKEGYEDPMDQDGYFMKAALERCETIDDFEKYLEETNGKRGVMACFGVIDAKGGAAYFEADPFSFEKFDVNDPKTAPAGYLIRTNFAHSGKGPRGGGYIRYLTLEEIFFWSEKKNRLSLEFLLFEATRCLEHAVLKTDLYTGDLPENSSQTRMIPFRDYVVRFSSVSVMVVQGVKKGEDPRLTTLWSMTSFPLSCLTVPVWVGAGDRLPRMVTTTDDQPAPLSRMSLELKKRCFPLGVWEGKDYLNLAAVLNKKGDGILQKILPEDRRNVSDALELLSSWRREGFQLEEAKRFYNRLDAGIAAFYRDRFELGEKQESKIKGVK